jgi:hypothetical protein
MMEKKNAENEGVWNRYFRNNDEIMPEFYGEKMKNLLKP